MRILVKHNGDPIGTYRTIGAGENPQAAMKRAVRSDYPQASADVEIRTDAAHAEAGDDFTNYSIVD